MGWPRSLQLGYCYAWNWGLQAGYGFALAASMSVDSLRPEFLNSSWRGGDGGKANVATTEEGGRLFLLSIFRPLP